MVIPRAVELVVIGASAGAIEALSVLLRQLPAACLVPIAIVVHLQRNRESMLPQLFSQWSALPVREPLDKEAVAGGVVWVAPSDYHLLVEADRTFSLSIDPLVNFSRPSIDVLFESAAEVYGAGVLAVVLTGANADGAAGAAAVRRAGGRVAVQDPASAHSKTMPDAAIASASPELVAALPELSAWLARQLPTRPAIAGAP